MPSDTGAPYHLPYPDGDDPPDGPTQIQDLAVKTALAINGVANRINSVSTDADNRIKYLSGIAVAHNNKLTTLESGVNAAATKQSLTELEKELTLQNPVVLEKNIKSWKASGNYSVGDAVRYEFTNISRKYNRGGTKIPVTDIAGVAVTWDKRTDSLVEEFEAWADVVTPKSFIIKVRCIKAVTGVKVDIGRLALIVVLDNSFGEAADVEKDRVGGN